MQSNREIEMKPGDLVVVASPGATMLLSITGPGKTRWMKPGKPALIVDVGYTVSGNGAIKKFKILLDGELWWASGNQLDLFDKQ
jgi:hypothetical protein